MSVDCGENQCEWEWNGNAWDQVNFNCPECCSCDPPSSAGNVGENFFTPCVPIEGCPPDPDPECGDRIFTSIRTNRCCCPCAQYRDDFRRDNCQACPDSKIIGMKVKISGAEGKYEEDYCEWEWNEEDQEWNNKEECPEHFECPEPDQSPPSFAGEIRKTLCDLIRGEEEEESEYQKRRQAVRKNMCCDNLNGEYFIPINRKANHRRSKILETPGVDVCGSKIYRLDGPAGARQFIGSGPGDRPIDQNYPIETIFESIKKIKNSEDPNDENFCEVQIEWEVIREFIVNNALSASFSSNSNFRCSHSPTYGLYDTPELFLSGRGFSDSSCSNKPDPDPQTSDIGSNALFYKIYISMSGNNKPNEFNYKRLLDRIAEVNKKRRDGEPINPEEETNFIDWNPDNEGLMLRTINVSGPLSGGLLQNTSFSLSKSGIFLISPYPSEQPDFMSPFSIFGNATYIRGPWQIFNCNKCWPGAGINNLDPCASIYQGEANLLWYRYGMLNGCCDPFNDFTKTARFANCKEPDFKLDTQEDKDFFQQSPLFSGFSLFMSYETPWVSTYTIALAPVFFNSVFWPAFRAWPYPTKFTLDNLGSILLPEDDSIISYPIIVSDPDYKFESINGFLSNFACGENIRVEAELVYEDMVQKTKHTNDIEPYSLQTPTLQAYGPNWKICSGTWFVANSQNPLVDSGGDPIYEKNSLGKINFLRKDSSCNPTGKPCFDSEGNPINLPECFRTDENGNAIPTTISTNGLVTISNNAKIVLLKKYGDKSGILKCLLEPLIGSKTRFYVYVGDNEDLCDSSNSWTIEVEKTFENEYMMKVWKGESYVENGPNTFKLQGSLPSDQIDVTICIDENEVMTIGFDSIGIVVVCGLSGNKYFAIGSGSNNNNPVIFPSIQHIEHYDSNIDCPACFVPTTCFPDHDGRNIFGYNITVGPLSPKSGVWSSACSEVCQGFSINVPVNGSPCISKKFRGIRTYQWFPEDCVDPFFPQGGTYVVPPAEVEWEVDCVGCGIDNNAKIKLSVSITQKDNGGAVLRRFAVIKEFDCNIAPESVGFSQEPGGGVIFGDSDWPCILGLTGPAISASPIISDGCCNVQEEE